MKESGKKERKDGMNKLMRGREEEKCVGMKDGRTRKIKEGRIE